MLRGKYNKRIIELVKNQPILYDTAHPQYKNSFTKYKIWNQLGAKINMSGNQLKQKWKNIRDSYFKHLRSVKAVAKGENPPVGGRYLNWPWASAVEFLREQIEISTESLPIQSEVVVPEMVFMDTGLELDNDRKITKQKIKNEKNSLVPTPSPAIPIEVALTGNKQTESQDSAADKVLSYLKKKDDKLSSTEHLMMGYAITMETFSDRRKILTKMKIAQVMMEAELEEEQERRQNDSHRMHPYADPTRSRHTHFTAEQNPHERFLSEDGIQIQITSSL